MRPPLLTEERGGPLAGAVCARSLLDGRLVLLVRMLFNLRLVLTDERAVFVEKGYCYHDDDLAYAAFQEWNCEADPRGWAKDPFSGRLGPCPCEGCERERGLPWNQRRLAG